MISYLKFVYITGATGLLPLEPTLPVLPNIRGLIACNVNGSLPAHLVQNDLYIRLGKDRAPSVGTSCPISLLQDRKVALFTEESLRTPKQLT